MTVPTGEANRYPTPLRVIHWIVAGAIVAQWYLGWMADNAADRSEGARLIFAHFQLGMALLALVSVRLIWRAVVRHGPADRLLPKAHNRVAGLVHALLYALALSMPVSGYVMWIWMNGPRELGIVTVPRLFTPPAENEYWRAMAWYVHHYSAWIFAGSISLHVAAALWHELILRDRLIRRRMM